MFKIAETIGCSLRKIEHEMSTQDVLAWGEWFAFKAKAEREELKKLKANRANMANMANMAKR